MPPCDEGITATYRTAINYQCTVSYQIPTHLDLTSFPANNAQISRYRLHDFASSFSTLDRHFLSSDLVKPTTNEF
jgi:hypothetical protein